MGTARKPSLDRRLEAYFASIRSPSLREALKRSAVNWQVYAAVSGSAMAMATGASASIIGSDIRHITPEAVASARSAKQHLASSRNLPFTNAIRLAMVRQDSGQRILNEARSGTGAQALAQPPSISPGGVVPIYSTVNTIQPGEFVSIYGSNLAAQTATWNGDFPVSLGGTSVQINGKPAFLVYVSPTQIDLQAPDDTATGTVPVVVTTGAGSATSTVNLSQFGPSFSLLDNQHIAGIILRTNGAGTYGAGTYDILGPTGNYLGYTTVAAQPGDSVQLFGVGFGPTTPAVPAGKPFSGAAPIDEGLSLYINHVAVRPTFVGLSSAGLYQINLVVPAGIGQGDVPIQALVGGAQTPAGVMFSLAGGVPYYSTSGGYGGSSGGFGFGGSFGGGFGGGSGGSVALPHASKLYQPKLQFGPK